MTQLLNVDSIVHIHVCLAQSIADIDDATVTLLDITECDFDGYARQTDPDWTPIELNGDDRGKGETPKLTWTAGAGISGPQTIKGVYVIFEFAGAGESLLWFQRLSPSVTLANPDEEYSTAVRLLADDLGI